MKATELIKLLTNMVEEVGDVDVTCKVWEDDSSYYKMYEIWNDIKDVKIENLKRDNIYGDLKDDEIETLPYIVMECSDIVVVKSYEIGDEIGDEEWQ